MDSICATFLKLDPLRRENMFEVLFFFKFKKIFGLDFMIDEDFKPFLIEINTNPDITISSPVCRRVIPLMVENALRIGVDPLFSPPLIWP